MSLYQHFITLFHKSKFRAMKPFKRLLCRRAEKNLELSQTSKMTLLEKLDRRFKNTNCFYNLTFDRLLETFIKYQLKTTVITDRLDQNRYRLV